MTQGILFFQIQYKKACPIGTVRDPLANYASLSHCAILFFF